MLQKSLWLRIPIVLLIFSGSVWAQRGNDTPLPGVSTEISGQLRASDRRVQLSGIIVRLESAGSLVDQTSPDANGNFRFARLKRGAYTVVVKMPGFRPVAQAVDLQAVSKAHVLVDLIAEEGAPIDAGVRDARIPPEALKAFERGKSEYEARRPARAIEHLSRAVAIYPDYFEAHLLLGSAQREREAWAEAERSLRRALAARRENQDR